jgi:hypothetical protein
VVAQAEDPRRCPAPRVSRCRRAAPTGSGWTTLRAWGVGARELLIRSVLLRICDHRLADAFTQIETGKNITWKRDSGHHAGHRRLVRRIRKLRSLIREQIREDGCGGSSRDGMLGRIRRALRHTDHRRDGWVQITRVLPVVCLL